MKTVCKTVSFSHVTNEMSNTCNMYDSSWYFKQHKDPSY